MSSSKLKKTLPGEARIGPGRSVLAIASSSARDGHDDERFGGMHLVKCIPPLLELPLIYERGNEVRKREIVSLLFSAFALFNIVWCIRLNESVFYIVGSVFLIASSCCFVLFRVFDDTKTALVVAGNILCAAGLIVYSAIVMYKSMPDFLNDGIVLVGMLATIGILWMVAFFGIFKDDKPVS